MLKKALAMFVVIFAASSLLFGVSTPSMAANNPPAASKSKQLASVAREKLVIQVSDKDPSKWNLALNNARNVQAAIGADKVDIEIVAYGPGIDMLKLDSEAGERVGQALGSGIKIVACQNTMKGTGLTEADMLPKIGYVPSGVIEIMKKQKEDYSYLRP